jgi:hypothetical protein
MSTPLSTLISTILSGTTGQNATPIRRSLRHARPVSAPASQSQQNHANPTESDTFTRQGADPIASPSTALHASHSAEGVPSSLLGHPTEQQLFQARRAREDAAYRRLYGLPADATEQQLWAVRKIQGDAARRQNEGHPLQTATEQQFRLGLHNPTLREHYGLPANATGQQRHAIDPTGKGSQADNFSGPTLRQALAENFIPNLGTQEKIEDLKTVLKNHQRSENPLPLFVKWKPGKNKSETNNTEFYLALPDEDLPDLPELNALKEKYESTTNGIHFMVPNAAILGKKHYSKAFITTWLDLPPSTHFKLHN